jgi:Tfp pilus assembly protein PilN
MRPVNLIPTEHRRQSTGAQSGSAYVIVGVLGVLLVMSAFYVMTSNKVNDSKTNAAQAKAEADRLQAQTQVLGPFANFTQVKQTRLTSVAQVATSRFDWERTMRELSRVIPKGSWLQSLEAGVSGAPGDAATTTQNGETGGPPTAQLLGCTPRQSDVAKTMVRLREMHGVADVKLNESSVATGAGASSDSSSGGGGGECGKRYQFDVTVTFGAITQGEAPRGGARVPATLGGGS